MRLAIGLILSPGYSPPPEFFLGRAEQAAADHPEGYLALCQRIQTGQINLNLPGHQRITGFRQITARKFPTDVARNEVCAAVCDGDEDYLLFLDCDMVHPATLLEDLLAASTDVVTARYHLKKPPFAAVAYVKHPTQTGRQKFVTVHFGTGTFEIERGGAGALLIHRSVLLAIRDDQIKKWRAFLASDAHAALPDWMREYLPVEPIIQWFRYQQGPDRPHDLTVSEDYWFWRQARELGFVTQCAWDVECQHLTQMAVNASWNKPFLHDQVSQFTDPAVRDLVLQNTVVRGYRDGMYLGPDVDGKPTAHIPEYAITGGER